MLGKPKDSCTPLPLSVTARTILLKLSSPWLLLPLTRIVHQSPKIELILTVTLFRHFQNTGIIVRTGSRAYKNKELMHSLSCCGLVLNVRHSQAEEKCISIVTIVIINQIRFVSSLFSYHLFIIYLLLFFIFRLLKITSYFSWLACCYCQTL